MMVIWIFRISTVAWNYTEFIIPAIVIVNVFYSVLMVENFISAANG